MKLVYPRYCDGHHWLEEFTDGHRKVGYIPFELTDQEWADYQWHCERNREWERRIQNIDNEIYGREHPDEEQA